MFNKNNNISVCPKCNRNTLWHNSYRNTYECLNPDCKISGPSIEEIRAMSGGGALNGTFVPPPPYDTQPQGQYFPVKKNCHAAAWIAGICVIVFLFLGYSSRLIPSILANDQPQVVGIDPKTGEYLDYQIDLVKETGGYDVDSYGDPIVLINNKDAHDPSWTELYNFLNNDRTDTYDYDASVVQDSTPFHGAVENYVDLPYIQGIIDGTAQPKTPRICSDFAELLHNNAEMDGIKCGYVTIDFEGQSVGHAIDAFETTDQGLVYVDDTGSDNTRLSLIPIGSSSFGGRTTNDKIAYVGDGKEYGTIDFDKALSFGLTYQGYLNWLETYHQFEDIFDQYNQLAAGRDMVPEDVYNKLQSLKSQDEALANTLGCFWESLGTVTDFTITWNGNWNN